MKWPKAYYCWIQNRILYVSIPFTWELPKVLSLIQQRSFFWDKVVVGGPAVQLMPGYFQGYDHVSEGQTMPGILQQVNPLATRTTTGCIRQCPFCGVKTIEGKFMELSDWPDLPILCDNNLLAASTEHFDRVIDRLEKWGWCDFNQGIDARLLNDHHAERIARIKEPVVRLALDSYKDKTKWSEAYALLRKYGIAKRKIRTYVLIGYDSEPAEAWNRCEWVDAHGVIALPMWFHKLDTFEKNHVNDRQKELGWNDFERRRIMKWFYWHQDIRKN